MRKKAGWITLAVLVIGIKIFSLFPEAVEVWYATGFYPAVSQTLRILLGWIPFSIGDILYAVVILILLHKTFLLIRKLVRRQITKRHLWYALRWVVYFGLWVYVFFNLLWGLNYNRIGIARQLNLEVEPYTKEELARVMQVLANRLTTLDSAAHLNRLPLRVKSNLFEGAIIAYENLWDQNARFSYSFPSIKPSVYSYLGNYMGYSGYYNPFTGEAQVNTTVPEFTQPFVACHEIGHQIGYAKENEANFAGFLSGRSSENPAFKYSVYFELYSYGNGYLFREDSVQARELVQSLPLPVREDFDAVRDFFRRHQNPFGDVIDVAYGQYLRANQQPSGKMSYNEVIAWLVAYYKKYGADAI